jgi:hypothetical protein
VTDTLVPAGGNHTRVRLAKNRRHPVKLSSPEALVLFEALIEPFRQRDLDQFFVRVDEYVVYVAPSSLQLQILNKILTPKLLQTFTRGATAQCLALSQ